ncbi:transcriptional repressor LexA (plasmid) [Rossellomorea sp. AcN35-11]|nr:transcriptional repressor LexA [Rossellomorea aquimaris]WJV31772.1 transcriptional repressor LexA [Rossellomorea sp. AcN35-11]
MATLTNRQEEILNFIIKRIKEKGYPPSVREIGANVGLSSTSTVHLHLTRLEEKGVIRKDPTKPRALEIIDPNYAIHRTPGVVDVPVYTELGGKPDSYFKLSEDIVGTDSVFILIAAEEQSKPQTILENDYIIIREQHTATQGDLILTRSGVDDESIVKFTPGIKSVIGKVIGVIRLDL